MPAVAPGWENAEAVNLPVGAEVITVGEAGVVDRIDLGGPGFAEAVRREDAVTADPAPCVHAEREAGEVASVVDALDDRTSRTRKIDGLEAVPAEHPVRVVSRVMKPPPGDIISTGTLENPVARGD